MIGVMAAVVDVGEVPPLQRPSAAGPLERLAVWRPTDTARGWYVTIGITLLGGLIRFWDLGRPTDLGTPDFDEKYYAPEAWQMPRNGGYEDNPGYEFIVHPPVGKYLIAVGEWLFGYDGWGWRFSSAIAGTVCILLIVRIARRLTRSTMLGALAGILLICDGVSHVMARMALLDVFVALFVLIAFACLLVDRDATRNRLATAVTEGWADESRWGPRLGFRWWRFAAGISLGLAAGVKWNGLYYVVAFGLLSVIWDATARRAAGVERPWLGAIVRDVLPALWSLAAIPVLVYVADWWAWFGSETGVDRHTRDSALSSFLFYEANVLHFHENLITGAPGVPPNAWESKPWTWPMGLRPQLFFYQSNTGGGLSAQMLIGTPAMWWLAFPMIGWSLWRAFVRFDWRHAAVMVGYMAGLLPWFVDIDRQMYFFYVTPLAPFLVLGLVLACGDVLGRAKAGSERRGTGLLLVAVYTGLVVADFVWLWPILNGDPISAARWQAELWLPSWR
ncbi:dolichyl-phosphate-mannose-protein mannosyltransferase [Kutzneria buriramensis]|uniref:Polyprenol-phosphate-mannose--protein mannosyltransferase n=2 Tax=Kutzneria buriramensis TaxID=1045776 RepID=A0A3E0H451_9PSEU|nr:dolichyl-phosphate-mannose-protein mannosyltransferase [Kutzneria buriramensis]